MMSSSRMTRSSSPLTFTVGAEYLPKRTRSPTFTSIGMSLPLSSFLPLPTATISPWSGFSAAVSGMTMPPADLRSSSMRLTITRSCSGRIFMLAPKKETNFDVLQWVAMTQPGKSRRLVLFSTHLGRVLMIAAIALGFKAGAADLPPATLKALLAAGIPEKSVAAWVQEVGVPRATFAWRADVPLNPASAMKLVTTYAALELLGPAFRWKTEAYLDGDNLVLRGTGDPKLTYESVWMLRRSLLGRGRRDP